MIKKPATTQGRSECWAFSDPISWAYVGTLLGLNFPIVGQWNGAGMRFGAEMKSIQNRGRRIHDKKSVALV